MIEKTCENCAMIYEDGCFGCQYYQHPKGHKMKFVPKEELVRQDELEREIEIKNQIDIVLEKGKYTITFTY